MADPLLLQLLPVGFGVALFCLIVSASRRQVARQRAFLQRMASALGARLELPPEDIFGLRSLQPGHLSFQLSGSAEPATIRYFSTGGKHPTLYTDFEAPMPQGPTPWSLSLRPQNALDALGALVGLQDVRLGAPAVDDAFVIKSDGEIQAMTYLCQPEVQSALLELRRLLGNGHLQVRAHGGEFRVRKLSYLEDEAAMRAFFQGSSLLYSKLSKGQRFELVARP